MRKQSIFIYLLYPFRWPFPLDFVFILMAVAASRVSHCFRASIKLNNKVNVSKLAVVPLRLIVRQQAETSSTLSIYRQRVKRSRRTNSFFGAMTRGLPLFAVRIQNVPLFSVDEALQDCRRFTRRVDSDERFFANICALARARGGALNGR